MTEKHNQFIIYNLENENWQDFTDHTTHTYAQHTTYNIQHEMIRQYIIYYTNPFSLAKLNHSKWPKPTPNQNPIFQMNPLVKSKFPNEIT